jgi:predicted AAA+ superfamily ATPase
MQRYIERLLLPLLEESTKQLPVTAILGPRQCGKSTLAREFLKGMRHSLHLDLERPSDLAMLRDPEAYFQANSGALICLDEIQRAPGLFPIMRAIVDDRGTNGCFLVLGSASPELLRQGSESLAGRIRYLELTPFVLQELVDSPSTSVMKDLWLRGGFPRSWLAPTEGQSFEWRLDFIQAFVTRDIPQLGSRVPAAQVERFWQMCAHLHGQVFNSSRLGESMGVSHHTARSYLDLLHQTYMLRVLPPLTANLGKRLIKSPKVFIRDSGLLHALHGIRGFNDLLGHPVYGVSWEGFVLDNVLAVAGEWKASFYRTSSGNEIDLVLERGRRRVAIECTASSAPEVTRGFRQALGDLDIAEAWIIAPVKETYPAGRGIAVTSLPRFLKDWKR